MALLWSTAAQESFGYRKGNEVPSFSLVPIMLILPSIYGFRHTGGGCIVWLSTCMANFDDRSDTSLIMTLDSGLL
jgi:hypothetical protein